MAVVSMFYRSNVDNRVDCIFLLFHSKPIDFRGKNEVIFSGGICGVFIPSSLNHMVVQLMDLNYLIWSRSTESDKF